MGNGVLVNSSFKRFLVQLLLSFSLNGRSTIGTEPLHLFNKQEKIKRSGRRWIFNQFFEENMKRRKK